MATNTQNRSANGRPRGAGNNGKQWNEQVYNLINAGLETLPARIMAVHFERNPALEKGYDAIKRGFYLEDTASNLSALASAVLLQAPESFADYVAWLKDVLSSRNIPTGGLPLHFECVHDALREMLGDELWQKTEPYWQAGLDALG